MSGTRNRIRQHTAAGICAVLMMLYTIANFGAEVYSSYFLPMGEQNPSVVWIPSSFNFSHFMTVIYPLPFALFAVYLLFLHRRHRGRVLMPIIFVLAAVVEALASVSLRISASDRMIVMTHIVDRGTFVLNTYHNYLLSLIAVVVYVLFALDGFCKFRFHKISRVLAVGLFGAAIVTDTVQLVRMAQAMGSTMWNDEIWKFSTHPLVSMVLHLLLYGSLIVFFFGVVGEDGVRHPRRRATVTCVAETIPVTTSYCGRCGSLLQDDSCPNCGAPV